MLAAASASRTGEIPADSAIDSGDELLLDDLVREDSQAYVEPATSMPPRRFADIAMGGLLGAFGAGWIAILAGSGALGVVNLPSIANLIALASGPLALLGIVYLLIQRSPRGEVRRFGDTALAMRVESRRLEAAVARVSATLDNRRAALAEHTAALLGEGDRAAERLSQISIDMRDETDLLKSQTDHLRHVTGAARGDMSALMVDLPRAQEVVVEIADLIRTIGDETKDQAHGLAEQLTLLIAKGQDADELIGAATGKLINQIGRLETRTERTAKAIDEAGVQLARAVGETIDTAGNAVEQTRIALDSQRDAMVAMIAHGGAALDEAGSSAAAALAGRLDRMAQKTDALAKNLTRQDEAARALVANLEYALGAIEGRFRDLGATGAEQTADLAEMIVNLSGHVETVTAALANSVSGTRTLTERANGLHSAFEAIVANIEQDLPLAMQRMDAEAARGGQMIRTIMAEAEQLVATVERTGDRLGAADSMIERQRDALAALGDQAAQRMENIASGGDAMLERQRALSDAFAEEAAARLEALRDHAAELGRLVGEGEAGLRSLAELSGSRLIDAIFKVREAAADAARSAREALESIVPAASETIARSGTEIIERTFGDAVTQRIHLISDTAEAAVKAANAASETLLTRMLSIAEAGADMEQRIAGAKAQQDAVGEESFAREVAVLISQLNAEAIDVTRILSHDVPDGAWAAYLHGDHGAFTRAAVRLLTRSQAAQIAAIYAGNPVLRDHVNRYIHDFEALLRRILASRDGGALGVTMLSSDMGKLYVALAQAIERLLI